MGLTISIVPTVHGGLWSCDRLPALPRTLVAKPKHPENRGHSQIPPLTTSGAGRNLAYEVHVQSPFSSLAPLTTTWSSSWKLRSKVRSAMPFRAMSPVFSFPRYSPLVAVHRRDAKNDSLLGFFLRHGVGVARSRADGAASSRIVLMLVKKPSNQLLQLELTVRVIHSSGILKKLPLDFSRKFIPLHDHRRAKTPQHVLFSCMESQSWSKIRSR
jgi:hypothetical protein